MSAGALEFINCKTQSKSISNNRAAATDHNCHITRPTPPTSAARVRRRRCATAKNQF